MLNHQQSSTKKQPAVGDDARAIGDIGPSVVGDESSAVVECLVVGDESSAASVEPSAVGDEFLLTRCQVR